MGSDGKITAHEPGAVPSRSRFQERAQCMRSALGWPGQRMAGALRFGAAIWIALAAPVIIEAAIYVRLHSMVVLGQVIDWLTTCVLACVAASVALQHS